MARGRLHLLNGRAVADDLRGRELHIEIVGPLAPPRGCPDAQRGAASRQVADGERIVEAPVHGRAHQFELGRAAAEILGHAAHEIIRQRLDRIPHAAAVEALDHGPLASGHGIEGADRPAAGRAAGQLRRAEDGRGLRFVDELVHGVTVGRQLRRATDAARAEHRQARHVRAEEAAQPAEAEVPRALDEERPPLVEGGLEVGEIHDGRIDLDLSKVGVHRRGQREVRGEQHASVQADAAIHGVRVVKRIARRAGDVARAADDVGQHLGAARRAVDHEPVHVPEFRGAAGFVELPERPLRQLVETVLLTPDLQAPGLLVAGRAEPELRERNAHLRRPAERIDGGLHLPDRIPRRVPTPAQTIGIVFHARWIDLKKQPADVIVVRIEDHLEIIGVHVRVAPHEAGPHATRPRVVVHAGADVQRRSVEREANLRALRRELALVRLCLAQPARRRRTVPHRFVEPTVQMNLLVQRHRLDFRGRRRMDVLRCQGRGTQHGEEDGESRHGHGARIPAWMPRRGQRLRP